MSERRAPVQRDCQYPPGRYGCTHTADSPEHHTGTVSWEEHEEAARDYNKRHDQSAETLAKRGGFGYWEICKHLGHAPKTWEPNP